MKVTDLVKAEVTRLKSIDIKPIIAEDGYGYCGLEDSQIEALAHDIQSTEELLAYVEGRYKPATIEELKTLDKEVNALISNHIRMLQYNLAQSNDNLLIDHTNRIELEQWAKGNRNA